MEQFLKILLLPDNVPIILMGVLTAFFTLLAGYYAHRYDSIREETGCSIREAALGEVEASYPDRVTVWPHLVRSELLCAILVMAFLMIWSTGLNAPLEAPANPNLTPNPSKAPWYFLGLQELLVYFDPWIAGVVLPNLILVGLMAIPYVDPNPKGNGYYTWKERKFAISFFLFGFLFMWVSLIIIGTFLRGPGWMFFMPGEKWDPNRVEATKNIDFSEFFGIASSPNSFEPISVLFGSAVFLGFTALCVILPYVWLKAKHPEFLKKWGMARFLTTSILVGWTLGVVIKVVLRLGPGVKYILVTPWFTI